MFVKDPNFLQLNKGFLSNNFGWRQIKMFQPNWTNFHPPIKHQNIQRIWYPFPPPKNIVYKINIHVQVHLYVSFIIYLLNAFLLDQACFHQFMCSVWKRHLHQESFSDLGTVRWQITVWTEGSAVVRNWEEPTDASSAAVFGYRVWIGRKELRPADEVSRIRRLPGMGVD